MLPALGRAGVLLGRPDRLFVQKLSATEVRGRTPTSRSAPGVPRAPVTPCAHRSYRSMRESIPVPDRAWFILPIPYRVRTSDPILFYFASPYRCSALSLSERI